MMSGTPLDGRRDPAKRLQIAYFRNRVKREFEIERPSGAGRLYEYLVRFKFNTAVRAIPFSTRGILALNVCCGSGMDLEFMVQAGARVIGLDLSKEAVLRARERARRHGFAALLVVGDAENLPLRDQAVQLGFVHDGLHHLSEPHHALRELVRVTGRAVLLIEPANAGITRMAVKLRISMDYEEAGNYVYRLSRQELTSLFHSVGVHFLRIRRYLMYYHHEPKWYYRFFDHAIPFTVFRLLFGVTNALVGRWGNKLMCLAVKAGPAARMDEG